MNDGKRFITDIRTGNRRRQSLGYLNQLAASIADEGLHDPIVITPGSQLISGYRRMKAAKLLGLEDIPVHVAGSLAEAVNLIAAEGSTCQVPMAAVELVDYIGIIRTLRRTPRMSTVREAGNAILDYSYSKYCLVQQVVEAAREEVDADGPAHQGLAVVDAILAGQRPRGQGGHLASLKAIAEELVGPPVPLHRTAPSPRSAGARPPAPKPKPSVPQWPH